MSPSMFFHVNEETLKDLSAIEDLTYQPSGGLTYLAANLEGFGDELLLTSLKGHFDSSAHSKEAIKLIDSADMRVLKSRLILAEAEIEPKSVPDTLHKHLAEPLLLKT